MGPRPDERFCLAVCDRGHMDSYNIDPDLVSTDQLQIMSCTMFNSLRPSDAYMRQ